MLLEFEQVIKDFLDLEIYRYLIKLLDQTKRKTKKIYKREREIRRMRKESHIYVDKDVGCNSSVMFCLWRRKVHGKKFSFCYQQLSKPKFKKQGFFFFFFFKRRSKNFETFFLYIYIYIYKIKYCKSSATNTILSHKNCNKILVASCKR